jgi:hypothetical protein
MNRVAAVPPRAARIHAQTLAGAAGIFTATLLV